jgi:hypothetical protein
MKKQITWSDPPLVEKKKKLKWPAIGNEKKVIRFTPLDMWVKKWVVKKQFT